MSRTNKIKVLVNPWQRGARVVDVAVNTRSKSREAGNEVKRVLKRVGPVLVLLDALLVGRSELAVVVEGSNTHAELCHRVQCGREANRRVIGCRGAKRGLNLRVKELLDVRGEFTLLRKLTRELARFSLSGHLAREEKPKHTLGNDLLATGRSWQDLLAVGDAQTMEADALVVLLSVTGITGEVGCRLTSLGSRTDASQSMDFKPRIPPMRCSTLARHIVNTTQHDWTATRLTLTSPNTAWLCSFFYGGMSWRTRYRRTALLTSLRSWACFAGITSSRASLIVCAGVSSPQCGVTEKAHSTLVEAIRLWLERRAFLVNAFADTADCLNMIWL